MYERIAVTFSGRSLAGSTGERAISDVHQHWIEGLLAESPASLQGILLAQLPDGELTMEWQSVFQGAGVAYVNLRGNLIAVALLLEGKFVSSESAAMEAVQQTLVAGKTRSLGFDTVRKHRARPLRAVVYLDDNVRTELVDCVEYWTDCLATACFRTSDATPPEARPAMPGADYSVSAV